MTAAPSPYIVQGPVTAVQDRSTSTVTYVQELLGIEKCTQADRQLELLLGAAKQAADTYMQNPFLQVAVIPYDDLANWHGKGRRQAADDPLLVSSDEDLSARTPYPVPTLYTDPRVELTIPFDVELGIVEYVRGSLNLAPVGVGQEKIGDWQRTFTSFATVPDRLASIQATYWASHRIHAGF